MDGGPAGNVRLLNSVEEVRGLLASTPARRETLSLVPAGAMKLDILTSSWQADVAMLRRGVTIKVVYHSESARHPALMRYLTEFSQEGAEVRIRPELHERVIIIDRQLAVVAAGPGRAGGSALVVEQAVLVKPLVDQFHELWRNALTIGVDREEMSHELMLQTLRTLQRGLTDEASAKHLGVSVRTLRRRIAALMKIFEVSTRFELGVRAGKAGWL